MIIGKDCEGTEIIPIPDRKLSFYTNRHNNLSGFSQGWIEGCTKNIFWENNSVFDEKVARELVNQYNKTLQEN